RVVRALRAGGEGRRFGRSRTAAEPFPGGSTPPDTVVEELARTNGRLLDADVLRHLAWRYGDRARRILELVSRDRSLGGPLLPELPDARAEVGSAVEREFAVTLEDVLRRRTQIALFDPSGGAVVAPDVAALMASPLGWTPETTRHAAEEYAETRAAER